MFRILLSAIAACPTVVMRKMKLSTHSQFLVARKNATFHWDFALNSDICPPVIGFATKRGRDCLGK
jgi:hypothetical protein